MYLRDNFGCGENGIQKYFDYMKHMDELKAKDLYTYQEQVEEFFKETNFRIVSDDEEETNLVMEFLDVGEKEFFRRHQEISITKVLRSKGLI